jgi:hypothetical protein
MAWHKGFTSEGLHLAGYSALPLKKQARRANQMLDWLDNTSRAAGAQTLSPELFLCQPGEQHNLDDSSRNSPRIMILPCPTVSIGIAGLKTTPMQSVGLV